MQSTVRVDNFTTSLGCLLIPAMDRLATQLSLMSGLSLGERELILERTRESLTSLLHGKVTRLLLVELHAARVSGRLRGTDTHQRWDAFLDMSSRRSFWDDIGEHYPSLSARISTIVQNRCAASLLLAQRWVDDRGHLASLLKDPANDLEDLSFGAGDSHGGGFTVAILRCKGGRLVYKPRSVSIDKALGSFIGDLKLNDAHLNFRVPRVIVRNGYGWAEFIEHRYASNESELRKFYRGIGHCLAVMHLLGASDLHAENLIAAGDFPVVVDCETMFTPQASLPSAECGEALDHALQLVSDGVLGIGLLPGRAQALGWRGVDYSGIGYLPGQQPAMELPTILKAGTDEACLGMALVAAPVTQNHPSSEPALALYWPDALNAFQELSDELADLDAAGKLEPRLQAFSDCRIRVVLRPTEAYAEIARMLWHPVSLHNEEQAYKRAYELLEKMAVNTSSAPETPEVIHAELSDLISGDFPIFTAIARKGEIEGPRGTRWRSFGDLIEMTLTRWRNTDLKFERQVMRAAMVSAYLNDGWTSHLHTLEPQKIREDNLERRRRAQLSRIMRSLVENAILKKDKSVTWVAPVYEQTGWSVSPLGADLYGGLSGVALLGAAYIHEVNCGRADPVQGVQDVLDAALHSLHLAEKKAMNPKAVDTHSRPPPVGGYVGLGSQIWTLLTIAQLNAGIGNELERAREIAKWIPDAVKADDTNDVLTGGAGAIPTLLLLADRAKDELFVDIAREVGDRLCANARYKNHCAYWAHPQMWPNGLGGFSHGVTGVGWSLTKLARVTGEPHYEMLAEAAFAFEDTLFDADEENWIDLRYGDGQKGEDGPRTAALWCHGSVGIGLAHLDLDPYLEGSRTRSLVRKAVTATVRDGLGSNHCLCHGDLGAWEFLDRAIALGEGPSEFTNESLRAYILTSIEDYGASYGSTKEVFVPGLLPGIGGIAYQLMRMHNDSRLPSVLTLSDIESS